MKIHELKIEREYFRSILNGTKTFEIRKNDRDFKTRDILILKEIAEEYPEFTGRTIDCKVTYITNFALQENYVCMGIKII